MSSTRFERPFDLPAVEPARRAAGEVALVLLGAAVLAAAVVPDPLRIGLALWLLACLGVAVPGAREAPLGACWRPGVGWGLPGDDGPEPAEVMPATRVFRRRVVLCLRGAGGRRVRLVLRRGSLPAATHRRLRVLLRFGRG